jgi:hypothetical protein
MKEQALSALRAIIQESLRVQRGGAHEVAYIDAGTTLADVMTRQNHVVFARRGCGKTLLLHHSATKLSEGTKAIYLNCEDFKKHSFPNVLIEILDAVFGELERHLTGWFGRKKRSRQLIQGIRRKLEELKHADDTAERSVREKNSSEQSLSADVSSKVGVSSASASGHMSAKDSSKAEVEKTYQERIEKLKHLDTWLPELKRQLREFFETSSTVKSILIQIDDLYHLKREDQAFVVDYVHRLCKDLPLFFKIATLRHASVLYVDRGQPIGAQERHDYQPINIDYTFNDFKRTKNQNRMIFHEFGRLAKLSKEDIDQLFKGEGFERLVMAGGGVPRDTLSLFLEVLSEVQTNSDGKIGKDDVRILSRSNFERRIEELKQDSQVSEQDALIKGIYVLRSFCLERKTNIFLVSEKELQQQDYLRNLIYRLLDYRIIHSAGTAITHKSHEGTYQAFAIDIGCYAHLRKLQGRFNEIDLSQSDAKEKVRSAPVLDFVTFSKSLESAPAEAEQLLTVEEVH